MASRRPRPGRSLVIFFLGMAVLYGLVALAQSSSSTPWKPTLGLDLQGGTRITLTAKEAPSKENLDEARRIIDQRVNGSGVAEAVVATQGSKNIVVEVPGKDTNRELLEETVKRQAQLRFRLVACVDGRASDPCALAASGGGGLEGLDGLGLNRGPALGQDNEPTAPADDTASAPADGASDDATDAPADGETPAEQPADDRAEWTAEEALDWITSPDPDAVASFSNYYCDGGVLYSFDPAAPDAPGQVAALEDDPNKPIVACSQPDETGASAKYLLSGSVIEGTELDDASAQTPQGGIGWVVAIEMGNSKDKARPKGSPGAADDFRTISAKLVQTAESSEPQLFAIVLDRQVLSAPRMTSIISDGRSQIEGDFSEQEALDLANSLKFGALPITFNDEQTSVEEIGPSLAGNQLTVGLTALGVGLGLVMLYCLFYYRGLGLVVVASLAVAAVVTYGMVLLLSKAAGFTLTLPGIAGLIIAVGVTADSFIIFFERIRDEMREGKSMRVSVETGWARARVTRVAANTVQLLSALILYIFATGAVKGFGFVLGLTTLIDLAVLFWFTKPAVSWLAQFKAFNSGHRFSGLSKETLGIDVAPSRSTISAGGDA